MASIDFPRPGAHRSGVSTLQTTSYRERGELEAAFRTALGGTSQRVLLRLQNPRDEILDFATSVASGMSREPPQLDCRFLYDRRGSELFERITEQPEYYPTRTEAGILRRRAPDLATLTGPVTLVELGSGSSAKTHHLLAAYQERFGRLSYVPVDVSPSALQGAVQEIAHAHSGVRTIAVHGRYEDALSLVRTSGPVMVMFLGSSIGNFDRSTSARFWAQVAHAMPPGAFFLLGVDLVKDRDTLERAYDDAAGMTRAFTRNLFGRMNRELGATIDLGVVEHEARYHAAREQVEICARFTADQRIDVGPLGEHFAVAAGDRVLVEISRKFRLEDLCPMLDGYGLPVQRVFTDSRQWFALLLLQRNREPAAT